MASDGYSATGVRDGSTSAHKQEECEMRTALTIVLSAATVLIVGVGPVLVGTPAISLDTP